MDPLLEVQGLSVHYSTAIEALHQVDLTVASGAITAVLGGNGAGKTTLLRALSGTLHHHGGQVSTGSIRLAGEDLTTRAAEHRTRAGLVQVPEGRRIFTRLSVEENLRVGEVTNTGDRAAARERVLDLFPALADRLSRSAGLLSGGEQQMLAIGRALMADPQVLLLDEPTLGLAPRLVETVTEQLVRLREEGLTLLLVEQYAAVALDLAAHGYVLHTGSVALSGPAEELRSDVRVRRLYLGEEAS